MGWTFAPWGFDQMIQQLITPQNSDLVRREVVDHTLVDNVLWAVVRMTAKQTGLHGLEVGESASFISCNPLKLEACEWGYNAIAEAEHPYYYSCPLHYLAMAPEECAEWRKRVRAHHADAQARGQRKVPAQV